MTNEKLKEVLRGLEEKHNVRVLYVTLSGSKLYGTDNVNSDTDYKFLFAPSKEDVLLKKDVEFLKVGKDTKEKNGADDVDLDGYSPYKFMDLLEGSETGAVDLLYSMFRKDTVVYEVPEFTKVMKDNHTKFQNRNMKKFVGYAVGQTKKFGVKGDRYAELDKLVKALDGWAQGSPDTKLSDRFDDLKVITRGYKYVKFVMAPNSRGLGEHTECEYFSVLGKMYEGNVTFLYMLERVKKLYEGFGNRTKTVAKTESKTDFKALSHALRVAVEVEELLTTNFLKFPLTKAERLKDVKEGRVDVDDALDEVRDTLDRVDELMLRTTLPEKSDREFMNKVVLSFLT